MKKRKKRWPGALPSGGAHEQPPLVGLFPLSPPPMLSCDAFHWLCGHKSNQLFLRLNSPKKFPWKITWDNNPQRYEI